MEWRHVDNALVRHLVNFPQLIWIQSFSLLRNRGICESRAHISNIHPIAQEEDNLSRLIWTKCCKLPCKGAVKIFSSFRSRYLEWVFPTVFFHVSNFVKTASKKCSLSLVQRGTRVWLYAVAVRPSVLVFTIDIGLSVKSSSYSH